MYDTPKPECFLSGCLIIVLWGASAAGCVWLGLLVEPNWDSLKDDAHLSVSPASRLTLAQLSGSSPGGPFSFSRFEDMENAGLAVEEGREKPCGCEHDSQL